MTQRGPFIFLVTMLVIAGLASAIFRNQEYGVPFLPGAQATVWQIEARIDFQASGGPTQAILTLPPAQAGFKVVSENAVSAGYGFAIEDRDGQRKARWSKRDGAGDETLYYKLEMIQDGAPAAYTDAPAELSAVYFDEPYQTAAATLLAAVLPRSADALTLAQQLVREINVSPKDQNVSLLLDRYSLYSILTDLLGQAGVPARTVQVLALEDGRRRQPLVDLVQVWQDGEWHLFNPLTGPVTDTSNLLLWQASTPGVLDVVGGTRSRVNFSIISQTRPTLALASASAQETSRFSLYSLPIEEQSMFKLIMLLPVGAFVVVFLRVMIGLKTSGTFMPVLIALAFLQTKLLPGVVSFLLVVSVGLFIRSYLSSLNLLLVARIATLVIVVVAIMSVFSILSYQLGLQGGLTLTFFPMIILAWTIERMSILWEESGPREVLIQGGGSLFVATLAYLLMDQELTRHLAFNFPELHLVVLALILMLGRYTGYRLSELRRFSPLAK
ncbi:MAG: inactive transglutaminase family protein [Gammaproteobacteria bacterium]|nr:inactive transglutaminase family protein [Gammaproteobacteria bacterium]